MVFLKALARHHPRCRAIFFPTNYLYVSLPGFRLQAYHEDVAAQYCPVHERQILYLTATTFLKKRIDDRLSAEIKLHIGNKTDRFWDVLLKVIVAAIMAAATALTTTSCMGNGPLSFEQSKHGVFRIYKHCERKKYSLQREFQASFRSSPQVYHNHLKSLKYRKVGHKVTK